MRRCQVPTGTMNAAGGGGAVRSASSSRYSTERAPDVCLHGTYHRGNAGILRQKNGIAPNDDRMTDFLAMRRPERRSRISSRLSPAGASRVNVNHQTKEPALRLAEYCIYLARDGSSRAYATTAGSFRRAD